MLKPQDHTLPGAGADLTCSDWIEVRSPYDGDLVGRVPAVDSADARDAVDAANRARARGPLPQHQRAEILEHAARLVEADEEHLATLLAAEAGKPLRAARTEVQRCASTLSLSAVEARLLSGTVTPMGATAAGQGKLGIVQRRPVGVVAAITPFNFPLNLVAHKLGPAIAAGNPVVLKPAEQTPLSALALAQILFDSGLPHEWLHVVTGPGETIGDVLVRHDAVAAITFTGSAAVGWQIRAIAPRKRVSLELGSISPLLVCADADWKRAADAAAVHAFSFAGQSCISVQRILVHDDIATSFTDRLLGRVHALRVGDPLDEETDVGPLISASDRDRVKSWVDECICHGGELLAGGELVDGGRCLAPTVLGNPSTDSHVWREEVFGPVATLTRFHTFDDAVAMANDSRYGLQAGLFTRSLHQALTAAERLEYGGVLVNEVPTFRADQMPYGGTKESGNTREGPAYAIASMTEERFISLQP